MSSKSCPLEKKWFLTQLKVWDPPWSAAEKMNPVLTTNSHNFQYQRDQSSYNPYAIVITEGAENGNFDDSFPSKENLESTLSRVKIIPNKHHVSAFLNKGLVKRWVNI